MGTTTDPASSSALSEAGIYPRMTGMKHITKARVSGLVGHGGDVVVMVTSTPSKASTFLTTTPISLKVTPAAAARMRIGQKVTISVEIEE